MWSLMVMMIMMIRRVPKRCISARSKARLFRAFQSKGLVQDWILSDLSGVQVSRSFSFALSIPHPFKLSKLKHKIDVRKQGN